MDLLKTIAIFGVCFLHGSWLLGFTVGHHANLFPVFRCAVPCFIVMWAYFFEKAFLKRDAGSQAAYVRRRTLNHLAIFASWTLIYLFLNFRWDAPSIPIALAKHWSGSGWSGQYYLIVLIQLQLLYPFIRKAYDVPWQKFLVIGVCCALYGLWGYGYPALPAILKRTGERPFVFWIPYVFLGISMARNRAPKLHPAFALFPAMVPLEFRVLKNLGIAHSPYLTPMVLAASTLLCLACVQSPISLNGMARKAVEYVGRNTTTVFVANPLIAVLLAQIPLAWCRDCPYLQVPLLNPLLAAAILFSVCLALPPLIWKLRLNGVLN